VDDLYVMNSDGTGVRWLAEGADPAWSPDGSRIAFSNRGIEVINADGSGLGTLISYDVSQSGDSSFVEPAWSPDGQSIAFVVQHGWWAAWQIYVINSDGSNPRPLAHINDYVIMSKLAPAWSPDGSRIAFGTQDWCNTSPVALDYCNPFHWAIASETLSGTDDRGIIVVGNNDQYTGEADWSPDGLSLAFSMQNEAHASSRIFLVTLATGEVQRLIPDAVAPAKQDYSDSDVSWSRGVP
jgi:Tol biopolymer transport system component